jgi:hypothetical protein
VTVNGTGRVPESECLLLLGSTRLAKVGARVGGRVEVAPVMLSIQKDEITFRTSHGSVLSKLSVGSPVLLEADGLHGDVAWMVCVEGIVCSIDEMPRCSQVVTVVMTVGSITGDRFALADPAAWPWR